jgi:hypothetical protein
MIISADKNKYSPPEYNVVKDLQVDVPIVLVTRLDNFKFNEELMKLDKYVLICMCEYLWDWDLDESGTHIWGENTEQFPQFKGDEWKKFDEWVFLNPPLLTLKRELLKQDVSDKLQPIDYPNNQHPFPIDSKETFDNRPITAMFFWGRSNECRVILHSKIWAAASTKGFSVCDNIYYFNEFLKQEQGDKWVSLGIPHYGRIDLSHILHINGLSKFSISLPGCGIKCFRSTGESPVNSIMVKHKDNLAWSYPWEDKVNCITVEPGKEIEGIYEALKLPNLYDIYLESMKAADFYRVSNYNKHLEGLINKA